MKFCASIKSLAWQYKYNKTKLQIEDLEHTCKIFWLEIRWYKSGNIWKLWRVTVRRFQSHYMLGISISSLSPKGTSIICMNFLNIKQVIELLWVVLYQFLGVYFIWTIISHPPLMRRLCTFQVRVLKVLLWGTDSFICYNI